MKTTLIKNINIIDGTGSPAYVGSILLQGDKILDIGTSLIGVTHDTEIDGNGLYACPGFIDMHSHSSLAYIDKPSLDAKTHQGVTSEVIGVDGLSVYPVKPEDVADWRTHLSGLEGNPQISWSWGTLKDYLNELPLTGTNAIPLVGHGTIRRYVMGMEQRQASTEELADMCSCLADCFEQGAWGLSTGLVYSPCTYSDIEELMALGEVVAKYDGVFVFHMRYEGQKVLESIEEVGRIGRECGCKIHISHLKALGRKAWGKADAIVEKVNEFRQEGIAMTADQYPYTAASTMMAALLPPWVHAAGPKGIKKLLSTPDTLGKIKRDMETGLDDWESFSAAAGWDNIIVSSVSTDSNLWAVGKSIAQIAESKEMPPFETVVNLLLEEEFAVGMVFFVMAEEDIEIIMKAPWVCFCTDGLLGGKPHPRAYATYVRILQHYVQKRQIMNLETAVRKATLLVAETLGLKNRGVIRRGYMADICIFDFNALAEKASYDNPSVHPEGIVYVFVNGNPVIWKGELSGTLSGRPILRG